MSGDRDSFILEYYTEAHLTEAHLEGLEPHDRAHASPAEAVATAWLVRESRGRALRVVKDSQVIYSEEELNALLDDISRRGARPGAAPVELAERAISESAGAKHGTTESQTKTTRRLNEAFRKATEGEQSNGRKRGKK